MLQHDYFLLDPLDNSWMLSRTVPIFFGMHDASFETVRVMPSFITRFNLLRLLDISSIRETEV